MLLLDEIAAHLDAIGAQSRLFDELLRLGTQAWMTGTDPAASLSTRRNGSILARRARPRVAFRLIAAGLHSPP